MICEVFDDVEDGLQHGIPLLLLEDEVGDGSAVGIAAIHHGDVNYSIPFSLGLKFNLDQWHPHVSIVEIA